MTCSAALSSLRQQKRSGDSSPRKRLFHYYYYLFHYRVRSITIVVDRLTTPISAPSLRQVEESSDELRARERLERRKVSK